LQKLFFLFGHAGTTRNSFTLLGHAGTSRQRVNKSRSGYNRQPYVTFTLKLQPYVYPHSRMYSTYIFMSPVCVIEMVSHLSANQHTRATRLSPWPWRVSALCVSIPRRMKHSIKHRNLSVCCCRFCISLFSSSIHSPATPVTGTTTTLHLRCLSCSQSETIT